MFWSELFSQQDPTSLDKFNLANFHHLKNNLKVVNEGQFSIHAAIKVASKEVCFHTTSKHCPLHENVDSSLEKLASNM